MNPSLVAARGNVNLDEILRELLELIDGPIFTQMTSDDCAGIVTEARRLAEFSERIVVKIPCNAVGLHACRQLAPAGVPVNMTLCFNPMQAVLAARAGARWISPFIGRLDDAGRDGAATLTEICSVLRNYSLLPALRVLAASIRTELHISAALAAGVHAVTLSPSQILGLPHDPLTEEGCSAFLRDWRNAREASNRLLLDNAPGGTCSRLDDPNPVKSGTGP